MIEAQEQGDLKTMNTENLFPQKTAARPTIGALSFPMFLRCCEHFRQMV